MSVAVVILDLPVKSSKSWHPVIAHLSTPIRLRIARSSALSGLSDFFTPFENSTCRGIILAPVLNPVKRDLSNNLPLTVRLKYSIPASPNVAVWGALQPEHKLA
jgi:hypothetical protein